MLNFYFWNDIKFLNKKNISFKEDILTRKLVVVPAAPAFVENEGNKYYDTALRNADIAIIDSSLFAILSRLFIKKVYKYSGYRIISDLLEFLKCEMRKIYLVDPTSDNGRKNKEYLLKNTILGDEDINNYTAPIYKKGSEIRDEHLLWEIEKKKPEIIIIGIAGGKQEILGNYLKQNLSFKTTILCTGAALSFFTGEQAPINSKIDKLHLGWLFRIIDKPKLFFPRYFRAFRFIIIFFKYKIST